MQVSESWVVYSYWSAVSQRTEMSTLSLYEGMIDKYGLSPFNKVSLFLSTGDSGLLGGRFVGVYTGEKRTDGRLTIGVDETSPKFRRGFCFLVLEAFCVLWHGAPIRKRPFLLTSFVSRKDS